MADYQQYLAILEAEPENDQALAALEVLADEGDLSDGASRAFDAARKTHRDRGAIELVARLLEIEIRGAKDQGRRADLLLEKGRLYADEWAVVHVRTGAQTKGGGPSGAAPSN